MTFVPARPFVFAAYLVSLAIYRLYCSPIAQFPGPKLAALSRWYEFYHEVALRGQFTFHIAELHRKYGPIVRINPQELHASDSEFWDTLYGPGRVDKYDDCSNRLNIPRSIFSTADYNLHVLRKAPLLPLFSKKRIADFQPVIREKLDILCTKIDGYVASGRPWAINRALTAFSGDVITTYVFSESYQHLESPDFNETFHEPFMATSEVGHVALQFKWLYPLMNALPAWLVLKMQPQIFLVLQLGKDSIPTDFDAKLKAILSGTAKENPDHPTILYELVRGDLPPQEKQIDRLNEEAQLLVAAGLTPSSWAMSVAALHIVRSRHIYEQLRAGRGPVAAEQGHGPVVLPVRQGQQVMSGREPRDSRDPAVPGDFVPQTNASDVALAHDFFLPSARLDSKGVRVTVKEAEK
ncbi:uncharacterized protein A1O5_13425 [Cladophialophora psammophila CBS 110553]|uniref:Cytochrome P450 n=1 Tax=Cladophialophora psammophila CBS 110553 TaxID=1182543 RepID=W9VCN0_9EURO|nr:uncharacterized protein A1O5_13425 [Cladophialophora psammophila CBS 110553]EXJ53332.1 hypothetical protein A1O5_13425 [Cladophialophora psammophila CBS 110553]